MLLHWGAIVAALVFLAALPTPARAYIPAQGTNQTNVAQAAGINFTDVSRLSLQWFPMGSYSETVSYQLVGADSLGISKVRFSIDICSRFFGMRPRSVRPEMLDWSCGECIGLPKDERSGGSDIHQ